MKKVLWLIAIACLGCSCVVQRATTSNEFAKDVRMDLPFKISQLDTVNGLDNTFSFRSDEYVGLLPDYEVDGEGVGMIYQTTFGPTHNTQPPAVIWRNIVINKRGKRVLCIDRLVKDGKTFGYVYVLQSETARYSDSGPFHWDVSNPKLMLNVSDAIEGMSELSVTTLNVLSQSQDSR